VCVGVELPSATQEMMQEKLEGGVPVFDHGIGDTIFAGRGGGEGGDDTFKEGKRKSGVGGRGGAPVKGRDGPEVSRRRSWS